MLFFMRFSQSELVEGKGGCPCSLQTAHKHGGTSMNMEKIKDILQLLVAWQFLTITILTITILFSLCICMNVELQQ